MMMSGTVGDTGTGNRSELVENGRNGPSCGCKTWKLNQSASASL
jgi:hypothetical protein